MNFNLYLSSFNFDEDIIDDNDRILITVSTYPFEMSDAILIQQSQMKEMNHSLPISIDDDTEKVEFIFSKYSADQKEKKIGYGEINSHDLQNLTKNKGETYNIFDNEKVIGKMNVQSVLPERYFTPNFEKLINEKWNDSMKCTKESSDDLQTQKVYCKN